MANQSILLTAKFPSSNFAYSRVRMILSLSAIFSNTLAKSANSSSIFPCSSNVKCSALFTVLASSLYNLLVFCIYRLIKSIKDSASNRVVYREWVLSVELVNLSSVKILSVVRDQTLRPLIHNVPFVQSCLRIVLRIRNINLLKESRFRDIIYSVPILKRSYLTCHRISGLSSRSCSN